MAFALLDAKRPRIVLHLNHVLETNVPILALKNLADPMPNVQLEIKELNVHVW